MYFFLPHHVKASGSSWFALARSRRVWTSVGGLLLAALHLSSGAVQAHAQDDGCAVRDSGHPYRKQQWTANLAVDHHNGRDNFQLHRSGLPGEQTGIHGGHGDGLRCRWSYSQSGWNYLQTVCHLYPRLPWGTACSSPGGDRRRKHQLSTECHGKRAAFGFQSPGLNTTIRGGMHHRMCCPGCRRRSGVD